MQQKHKKTNNYYRVIKFYENLEAAKNLCIDLSIYITYNYQFLISFRWVVLFSHPADFTPVCTTELGRIAVHKPHFERRNVKILAHSVDELKDHVDWVNVSTQLK